MSSYGQASHTASVGRCHLPLRVSCLWPTADSSRQSTTGFGSGQSNNQCWIRNVGHALEETPGRLGHVLSQYVVLHAV